MISDYDSSTIEYYTSADRTRTEEIKYSSGTNVLYNGRPATDAAKNEIDEILAADWGNKTGYITLICSQSGDTADVAFVDTYWHV